jgi:hypothetical protein
MQFEEIADMYQFGDKLWMFRTCTGWTIFGVTANPRHPHMLWSIDEPRGW